MLAIRNATGSDAPLLASMIREFAEFERERHLVETTADDLLRDGFRSNPYFNAMIAEWDGKIAGYALFFFVYSTWAGRPILFVEDLFVRAEFRRKGIGEALLKQMAVVAREKNCYGMRWEAMNWNTAAIDFYRSLDATVVSDRFQIFLAGDNFEKFAHNDNQR